MKSRHRWLLLLLTAGCAFSQGLPPYITSQYPAPSATGVPTNTKLLFNEEFSNLFYPPTVLSLQPQSGTAVAVTVTASYFPGVTLTPASALAPSTQYTFTITPQASIGSPYSFSFTTGSGPDTTPPHLIGFSPASGTTGLGLQAPLTALFDKPLMDTSFTQAGAVVLTAPGYYGPSIPSVSLTADSKGIIVQPAPSVGFPQSLQLTVDPTKIMDASGNAGQGPAQTAHYTTFVATSVSGPVLRTFFPADGSQGMPVNVSIRLLFDRPVDLSTAGSGITLSSLGTAVQTKYVSFASGQGVALQLSNLLAPNQTFQVTIGPGLMDLAGISLGHPSSFQFSTGANPDGIAAQLLALQPAQNPASPLNAVAAVRANKQIMPLAAVEYNSFAGQNNPGVTTAATAAISPDGQTYTLTPTAPLLPNTTYTVNLQDVVDVTGTPFTGGINFTTGYQTDNTPPSILAVTPPNGAQNIPTTSPVRILFSEFLGAPLSNSYVRLATAGQTVPSTLSWDSFLTTLTISPTAPLTPNTSYTIETSGVTDVAGNAMPPASTSFTTGSAPAPSAGYASLLSSSPAQGATGVGVNSSISFTFDSPLSPLAAFNGFIVTDSAGNQYPVTAAVSGSALTITPGHALLQKSTITASVTTTDLYGRPAGGSISFRTAGNKDATPLQVTSVSPPDGATISGPVRTITLTFNKAVDAASLANGISAYSNGAPVTVTMARTDNDLSLIVTPSLTAGDLTLVAGSSVVDMAGNSLAPFEARYTFVAGPDTRYANTVQTMRPASGSTNVPANTAITWFFTEPTDLATVNASLVVVANGSPAAGQFSLSPDGTVLTFQPSAPFPAGGTVVFLQRAPIFTDTYASHFTIAAPPAQLTVVRYTPAATAPANSVIEFEFSADVTPAQNLIALYYPRANSILPGVLIPSVLTSPRPRVIRLTPVNPLSPGAYVIALDPGVANPVTVFEPNDIQFQATAPVTSSPQLPTTGPQANSSGTPVSSAIAAAFNAPVNPLSVTASTVTIQSGGVSLMPVFSFPPNGRGLLATPSLPLPPNAEIDVAMTGLEDLYGNPIPDKSWKFVTGANADFSPLTLVAQSFPSSSSSNNMPQIQANEPIALTFNKPVNPSSITSLFVTNPASGPSFDVRYSDDLRTITLIPDPPLYKGQQITLFLPSITDLSGNAANLSSLNFEVAFDPDTTPPNLLQASPYDGQSGLPLNAEIIAAFDKSLSDESFGSVQLLQGATVVPLVQESFDAFHMRLSPAQPLNPNTTYTFVITGVTDLSGNVMNGSVTHTFTTGTRIDTIGPTGQILATGAPNVPIRVIFSEPVSAATVDSHSITLRAASSNSTYSIPVTTTVTLSTDGTTVTVTPVSPLTPNLGYQVAVANVRDFAGNPAPISSPGASFAFTAAATPDTTPPVVLITPPDGATVPVNTLLSFTVNKQVAQPAASSFRMTPIIQGRLARRPPVLAGQLVTGKLTRNGNTFGFTPDSPLTANTTYRIDIAGVTDLAGNASAPVTSTFTTSQSQYPFQFQLVSSSPASGAVGVAPNSPITLTFNFPIDPSTVPNGIFFDSGFAAPGSFFFHGNTVTFTPTQPWPSAQSVYIYLGVSNYYSVRDILGRPLSQDFNTLSFKTAAWTSAPSPQLLSESPPTGTLLTPPSVNFSLTFSESVNPGANGLTAFTGTQATPITASYSTTDYNTLLFSANVTANSAITIAGSAAIVDRAGNPITPFTLQYPTGATQNTGPPTVLSVSPDSYATGVAASTPIVLQFSKSMDPQSLMKSIRATQDGNDITGALAFSNSNQTAQFTPTNPYAPGSRIDIFVTETAADSTGLTIYQRYDSFFTVAGNASSMSVSMVSFGPAVTPEAALELMLDRPLDPRSVSDSNVWLRAGSRAIPGTVALRGDRIIRFVPAAPLDIGVDYTLTVGPGVHSASGATAKPEESPFGVEASAPAAAAETVKIEGDKGSSTVHIHFGEPVSPLSADNAVLIGTDGIAIPVERRISTDFRDLWLIPLNPDASIDGANLSIDNLEDRTGRRVAPWPAKLIARKTR